MKKQNKILDLTNSTWKAQKQWQTVGLKQSKIPLSKAQKIANTAAGINFIIPGTIGPVTSPIIISIGRRLSIKEKVKLYNGN